VLPLQNTEEFLQDLLLTKNLRELVDYVFIIKVLIPVHLLQKGEVRAEQQSLGGKFLSKQLNAAG
jgi:hypothetical protein